MARISGFLLRPLFSLIVFAGCSSPLLKVTDKKEVKKPFTNVMVVYVDGSSAFSFLDSTTYNIGIRNCLADTGKYEVRKEAEEILFQQLSSYHTRIVRSSSQLSDTYTSYTDFIRQTKDSSVEAVLLVDLGKYIHEAYISNTEFGYKRSLDRPASVFRKESVLDAGFQCYLFDLGTRFPVWIAQVEIKGKKLAPDKNYLKKETAKSLAASLVDGGFIAAH